MPLATGLHDDRHEQHRAAEPRCSPAGWSWCAPSTAGPTRVLAGEDLPRSRGHFAYVGLSVAKAVALTALGLSLLAV
ncbi:hypothetical protein ABZ920_03465 [Streptomyces sp. NPDC046831]|uniref:hypothetical protein n=1 Tax=Streptomyces sp. NPDC046831 TaxID=3154805 RepID=UPI0033E83D25